MATYRIVGRSVGRHGQELQETPHGKVLVPLSEVWEVGSEHTDVPADMLTAFPDRFERVDGPEDPLHPEGPPPEVTNSSQGGVAQSEPLSARRVPPAAATPAQAAPHVEGRRSAAPDTGAAPDETAAPDEAEKPSGRSRR